MALVVLGAAGAHAHLGGAEGVTPFVVDGVVVGAGTTWGLIGTATGAATQTCEEAIGDVPRDFVRLVDDTGAARVVAATGLGLVVSVDDGCTWSPTGGLDGRSVTALLPMGPTLVGITGGGDADTTADNDVVRSVDDGASFQTLHTTGALLTSLAVAVADATDATTLFVIAGSDAGTPVLLAGDADGVVELDGPLLNDATLVRALAVDDDAVWFSTLDGIGRGHLWRVPRAVDVVLDLATAVEVGVFDGLVRATGAIAGRRFAIAAGGVLHAVDDVAGSGIDPAAWQRTTEGPLSCLTRVAGDDRLWGCGTQVTGTWFKASRDGVVWEPVLPFDDVVDRVCPNETPADALCAYRFEPPTPEAPVDDPVVPPTTDDDGGHCSQGDPGLAALGALLVLVRRRRQR